MTRTYSRRRYIVDWQLQGSLIAHGLLYGGLVLVAIVGGIFLPLVWDLGDGGRPPQFEEQSIVMLWMHERLWYVMAICAAIVVVSAIRFSHRIAGPLVRYKRNLRLLAAGKLPPPLRTRPGDYLQEEVACLNAAVAGVSTRVEAIHRAQVAVQAEILALLARVPADRAGGEALVAASRELEHRVREFVAHDPGDSRASNPVPAAVPLCAAVE